MAEMSFSARASGSEDKSEVRTRFLLLRVANEHLSRHALMAREIDGH
jgi:hypothetical protein